MKQKIFSSSYSWLFFYRVAWFIGITRFTPKKIFLKMIF